MKKYLAYAGGATVAVVVIVAIGKYMSKRRKYYFVLGLFDDLQNELAIMKENTEDFTPGDISQHTQESLTFIHTVADVWGIPLVRLGDE